MNERPSIMRGVAPTLVLTFLVTTPHATADVVSFEVSEDWFAQVGDQYDTITFEGFHYPEQVGETYAEWGVHFESWVIFSGDGVGFEVYEDGWGAVGPESWIIRFDEPQSWFATDHPGEVRFALYADGVLVGTSDDFGSGGPGWFGGVISDVAFDEVRIDDPFPDLGDILAVDNMYWGGPVIPSPPAVAVFMAFGLGAARRRRR